MWQFRLFALVLILKVVASLPTDPLIKLDSEVRHGLVRGPDGKVKIVDLWLSANDLREVARYNPDTENQYHLFTRENPSLSQPLLLNNEQVLANTNFRSDKRTIILVHGWTGSATSQVNTVLVPAFLAAEDVNVIVVDWHAGGGTNNYAVAVINTPISGRSVANFINWLNRASGSNPSQYHLVGVSLGGQQVGIIGRNVDGDVGYLTALDPASPGWNTNNERLHSEDSSYTEVIHTNVGVLGFLTPLGHVDFYPNGGIDMPGCDSQSCDHDRCIFYLAESLVTNGFTGRRCASYLTALTGNCFLSETLNMGGLTPKTGESGVYYLETNAAPPFSKD